MGRRQAGDDLIRYFLAGKASLVLSEDGEKVLVDSLGPNEIFGEVSFFTGLPWPSDAELVADEPCHILEIPADDFERLIREDPDFAVNLVKNLGRKIIRLDRSILKTKLNRRSLQSLISREDHIFPDYVIGDHAHRHLIPRMEELAQSDEPVLIVGESGVGKEVLAHMIFSRSHHGKEVFLQVDLLRIRGDFLLTNLPSEDPNFEGDPTDWQLRLFFGSEEPAPDGGTHEVPGYFELSIDGTLLARGVEQLTAVVQMKLLEAITTETFRRQGGIRLQRAKVRLIVTTRLEASEITLERHPLLYALMPRALIVPPLRVRRREIPRLVEHYLKKYSHELRRDVGKLPKETVRTLVNYSWPGNDLELSSTVKRAVLVAQDGILRPQDIYFDLKRIEGRGKLNLLKFDRIKRIMMSPLFPAVLQSAAIPFLLAVMVFLFLGPTDPMRNPAALVSWALGWPVLILGAFLWARFWCSLCPIGTLGEYAKRFVALEKPFPAFLKNHSDFVVAAAVLSILWFEHVTGIRNSPPVLGLLLLAMVGSAILVSVMYERQSWCLYVCGLGGMMGVLAKASVVELRADRNVCISQCASNECYVGSADNEGCPFGQAGPRLHSNRLCKLCGTCVKNCSHGAINLNLRIPGRELWEIRHPNAGTAFLVIGMISGLFSEMATGTKMYSSLTANIPVPETVRFTMVFASIILLANLMVSVAAVLSKRVYGDTFRENYARYGLALLPLALTSFMAFHMYYFVTLGVQIPMLVSQTFQIEALRHLVITVPTGLTSAVQATLIWIGLIWTALIIYRLGIASHERVGPAILGMLPHAAVALCLALFMTRSMGSFFLGFGTH